MENVWKSVKTVVYLGIIKNKNKGFMINIEIKKRGRKVATRDWSALNETILSVEDKSDILSSLSSIKTHPYIGLKYSSSIDEEVSYQLVCEEACNQINDIEAKILESINHSVKISLDEDQLELLRDLVLMTTSEDNTNV